jgi:hypothetical protein
MSDRESEDLPPELLPYVAAERNTPPLPAGFVDRVWSRVVAANHVPHVESARPRSNRRPVRKAAVFTTCLLGGIAAAVAFTARCNVERQEARFSMPAELGNQINGPSPMAPSPVAGIDAGLQDPPVVAATVAAIDAQPTVTAGRDKPPEAYVPVAHMTGAALELDSGCTPGAADCMQAWTDKSLVDRLRVAEKRIVEALPGVDDAASRVRRLVDDRLLIQFVAHYNRVDSARSKPGDSPLLVPRSLVEKQHLAIVRYSPRVFAAETASALGETMHFAEGQELRFSWREANALIVDSTASVVEDANTRGLGLDLGSKYAVTITFRAKQHDVRMDVPVGAIVVNGESYAYQPLLVTRVAVVSSPFPGALNEVSRDGLPAWSLLVPAGRTMTFRFEGYCAISSLLSPNGRFRFSGWSLSYSEIRKLEALPDDQRQRQHWLWKLVERMLNAQ